MKPGRVASAIPLAVFSAVVAWSISVQARVADPEKAWEIYRASQLHLEPARTFPYMACFRKAAADYRLPLSLLLAVARGESDFDPRAVSNRNCYGIMQIRWPGTARHLGITCKQQLYEPCTNIIAGAKYLRELLDRYHGDIHRALAAYNYGSGRIAASARTLPEGAVWYSGYIYRHLQVILKDATNAPPGQRVVRGKRRIYRPHRKYPVITFNKPVRAEAFLDYIQRRAPSLNLDMFRIGLGRFRVVLLYDKPGQLRTGKKMLQRLGFKGSKN